MAKKGITKSPQQDTGWGLIFRLNDLWKEVEKLAVAGKYEEWSFRLDRIWCNLVYRDDLVIKYAKDGRTIISIGLSGADTKEKDFLDDKIQAAKSELGSTLKSQEKNGNVNRAKRKLYESLMLKDVWLRKFMMVLGLYLKEIEHDPSQAIYGGGK